MKRITGILILLSVLSAGCTKDKSIMTEVPAEARAADNEINIFHFNSPPHIYTDDNGELTGAIYDFIEEGIAPEMGIRFNWIMESTAIPREIEMVRSDANSAIALLSLTAEREKLLAYTEMPYYIDEPTLVVMKTNPLKEISTSADMYNLTIGYATGGYLTPMMKDENLNFDLISNSDYHVTNLKKLDLGRIDAVYAPGKITMLLNIQELNFTEKMKLLVLPDSKSTYYIVFSKSATELVSRYNAAFKAIDGQSFYIEKLKKYVDSDMLN